MAFVQASVSDAGTEPFRTATSDSSLDFGEQEVLRGSLGHGIGRCVPCFWRWKPQGCAYGASCEYCHSCPEGEVKARRKARVAMLRTSQRLATGPFGSLSSVEQRPPLDVQQLVVGRADSLASVERQTSTDARRRPSLEVPPPPAALAAALPGCPSVGSSTHADGKCRPCSWFYKASGCKNGRDCRHCHLCPEGEIKARRKNRLEGARTDPIRKKVSLHPTATGGVGGASSRLPMLLGASLQTGALPSIGSGFHGSGFCKPCAFLWKPAGCEKGLGCQHCHLCSEGELQTRRKAKQMMGWQASRSQASCSTPTALDVSTRQLALWQMAVAQSEMAEAQMKMQAAARALQQHGHHSCSVALAEPMSIALPEELAHAAVEGRLDEFQEEPSHSEGQLDQSVCPRTFEMTPAARAFALRV